MWSNAVEAHPHQGLVFCVRDSLSYWVLPVDLKQSVHFPQTFLSNKAFPPIELSLT